jgi:hypothetical protein
MFRRRKSGSSPSAPVRTSVPCLLWCEADDLEESGGFVDSWTDKSGRGHDLGTPIGGAPSRPAFLSEGWGPGRPAVMFDGLAQFMEANLSGPAGPAGLSIVLAIDSPVLVSGDRVVYWETPTSAHQITQRTTAVYRYSSAGGGLRDSSVFSSAPGVYAAALTGIGTDLQWYADGVPTNNTLTAAYGEEPLPGSRFIIGASSTPSAFAHQIVAAVMVFRGALSPSDIAAIQSYMALKGWDGAGRWAFSPAESAVQLPDAAVWVSGTGVTATTTVSAWASSYGGRSATLSQAGGTLQPAYSAAGGSGGRPLITFDGVDDVLEGVLTTGSPWSAAELGVAGSRVAFAAASDAWMMIHQSGGFIVGIRDQSATAAHMTTATTTANGTSDPDAVPGYYHGTAVAGDVRMRKNGATEGTAPSGSFGPYSEPLTVAIGGRVATGAYANLAVQGAVASRSILSQLQREYLRQLLMRHTSIPC